MHGHNRSNEQGDGWIEPIETASSEDDSSCNGNTSRSGSVGSGVEEDSPDVEIAIVGITIGLVASKDERSPEHDQRCNSANDEHGKAVDLVYATR
jgi:hypothetical protein